MLILSSILTAIDVLISKLYQKSNGDSLKSGLKFNFFVGLFSSIIFLALNKFRLQITLYSCIWAFIMTALAVAFIIIGFNILSCGKTAYYTFFRMTGAMIIPYIWGLFFLNEEFSAPRLVGLILIILSILIINSDKTNISLKSLLLCIIVFFLAGFVNIISKQHSINIHAVSHTDYIILTSFAKIILCGILLFFVKEAPHKNPKSNTYILILCALSACLTGVAYMLQLISAKYTPATLLFPIITGGTIIFSAIFARIFFKEKISKKSFLSIIICFIGTCMFI